MKKMLYKILIIFTMFNIDYVLASTINYNDVCANSGVGNVMIIVGNIINIAKWIVPLIIIVLGMIDFGKVVISNDEKAISKATIALVRRFIAGIVVFFVPTVIGACTKLLLDIDIFGENNQFIGCTNCMFNTNDCKETVKLLQEQEESIKNQEKEEYEKEQEEIRQEQERLDQEAEASENNGGSGSTDGSNGNGTVHSITNVSSGDIKYIDTSELGCTVYYDPGKNYLMTRIGFHQIAIEDMRKALTSTCSYVNRVSYMDYLQTAGSYVARDGGIHDYHRIGLAIDLNNLWSFSTNGKTYRPYSSQGTSTWNNYKKFICEVCNGKEDCKYNVNYQIYHNYFKQHGWCWGGNWSPEWFDPMHFELRRDGCSTQNKRTISCS